MFKKLCLVVLLGFIITLVFINYQEAFTITSQSVDLILITLLPTLFPFMLLLYLFIDLGGFYLIGYLLQFITIPLFNLSGLQASIILGGILGGYPMPAVITEEIIFEEQEIKKANITMALFSFPSLAFLLNVVIKNNVTDVSTLFLSFYGTAFFILFFSSLKKEKVNYMSTKQLQLILFNHFNNYSFSSSLKKSIKKGLLNIGIIFGNIVLFSLILIFINNPFILGFFEFSSSSIRISKNINSPLDYFSLLAILLWGGLSVLMQYLTILSPKKFKSKIFLKYKLLLIFSVLLVNLLLYWPII